MKDAKKEKLKKKLVDLEMMEQDDTIIDALQANCRQKMIGKIESWCKGWIYFTEKRIVYSGGLVDDNFLIPYENIRGIKKCMQGIFPLGIAVTYENPENDGPVTTRFSMLGRGKWMTFLEEKSGLVRA